MVVRLRVFGPATRPKRRGYARSEVAKSFQRLHNVDRSACGGDNHIFLANHESHHRKPCRELIGIDQRTRRRVKPSAGILDLNTRASRLLGLHVSRSCCEPSRAQIPKRGIWNQARASTPERRQRPKKLSGFHTQLSANSANRYRGEVAPFGGIVVARENRPRPGQVEGSVAKWQVGRQGVALNDPQATGLAK